MASYWNVRQKAAEYQGLRLKPFHAFHSQNAVIHVQFNGDVSLTGNVEKPFGLPAVLYSRPNPYSWHLCQGSRLSVTLLDGMQAAHTNSHRPDWEKHVTFLHQLKPASDKAKMLLMKGVVKNFSPSTETPVLWRHSPVHCTPTREKSQVSGPQDLRHRHDGESPNRFSVDLSSFLFIQQFNK